MIKSKMKQQPLFGTLIKIVDDPAMLIMAKDAGMDFVFYDCEHGMIPYDRLHDLMLMGNGIKMPSIVRAAQLARSDVSRVLDCGAEGVMVPMIETSEQARQLVQWSKYPPLGSRSYSGGANTFYKPSGNHQENMRELNQATITIAQIETVKGVENVDEIAQVEGIDALIVGPADLGISMGNPDNMMHPDELALIRKVANACKRADKGFGIIGPLPLIAEFKNDIDLLISAIDVNILRDGLKQYVKGYQDIIK
ncbi:HpcH/HpaI aldolase family protein [Dielma fastidiosa]|uniref:Aldolase/citrate lyase family protein n=1 Tax=Dielma fastidiosa TaxID=1034346 RepID=A0AB35UWR7_9FIRM|nr:aldolase/citrate lyase family protein [Dielma fastidiosa]MDY5169809.1 aldolase/citrate lyase family protein [Dielma fastidiosa]